MSNLTTSPKITQKQIAEQLGVSRQLVGFALSGQGKVAEDTRQKILEVARANGYDQFSNSEARSMISRRYGKRVSTGLLAVLFTSNFEEQPLALVPYFTPFFHGLELEAKESGLDLSLCPIRPGELPRFVRDQQLDGVICVSAPHEVSREVARLGIPTVNIQSDVDGISCVLRDDFGGSLQATRHLTALGHRRIAYLGYDVPSGHQRQAAYDQALRESGLPIDPELIDATLTEPTRKAGEQAMLALLERNAPFTAVVAYNDLVAMGAIHALGEAGLCVPQDISVIGFDDVAEQYDFKPSLTSVCFSREAMARRAVQILLDMTSGSKTEPIREIFSTRLVMRDSTGRPGRDLN